MEYLELGEHSLYYLGLFVMATVYILYSRSIDRYYIGSCNEMAFRLEQHLNKVMDRSFTYRADDWELYFQAGGLGYEQARRIEKHIKEMKSRKYLENLNRYSEIIEKLKIRYQ